MKFDFFCFLVKETFKGHTLFRIFLDYQIKAQCSAITGEVLDLASGQHAYYHYLLGSKIKITTTDLKLSSGVDLAIDLEKLPLPLVDNSFDNILLFNALCLLKNPENLFGELKRVLKPGGKLFFSSLLIAYLRPEPKDYNRWTAIKIEETLAEAGFLKFKIIPLGDRFSAALNLTISPLPSRYGLSLVKLFFYFFAIFSDKILRANIKKNHPGPIGYFCLAEK
jgi:SAM-dependent methyltransferase